MIVLDILDTFMTNQRFQELLDRGAEAQKIKDQQNRVQELLDLGSRAQQDKDAAAQSMGVGIAPALKNLKASTMGRPLGTESTTEPPPIVAPGIEAPKES